MTRSTIRRSLPLLILLSPVVFGQDAALHDWQATSKNGQCQGSYTDPLGSDSASEPGDTIDASANNISHVEDKTTTLEGDVYLRQYNQTLQADHATIDNESETYVAEGNVRYRQQGLLITGDSMSGNLFTGQAAIDSASFLLHKNRLRGTASSIARDQSGNLAVNDGRFTTCEPGDRTWTITGEAIEIKPAEGHGVARNVTLEIRDLPVAWFPYFRFPIDDRRQSGLLLPSIGSDSDGGTDIALPYYFNLAPNYDATYTLRSIWKRGLMHEGEIRYMNRSSVNTLAGAFLPSDDNFDDRRVIDASNPSEVDDEDRWLSHFSHRGRFGRFTSAINYTAVSDIDYFDDLGGFTRTDSTFDRQDSQRSSPALQRTGSLTYRRGSWRSALSLRSFQELSRVNRRQYEVLPRLDVSWQGKLGKIHTGFLAEYTAFDNAADSVTTGDRFVLDTSAQMPFRKPWGFVTPGLRVIHRDYSLDASLPLTRDDASITTTLGTIDAGLVFERNITRFDRSMRQTLEPHIQYLHASHDEQGDLPVFDSALMTDSFASLYRHNAYAGYDRIGDANRLSIGVTTRFNDASSGRPVLTARIGQMIHFEDRDETSLLTTGQDPEADTSPLYAEVSTQLGRLRVNAGFAFDTDSGNSNRGKLQLNYRGKKGLTWNFSYSMVDEDLHRGLVSREEEETDVSFQWPINERWQLVGRWNYGLGSGHTIESLLGVEYNDCCWKARVVFRRNLEEPRRLLMTGNGVTPQLVIDRRADSGIFFEFQLKGLASLGGRLDALLSDAVPGYRINR